MSSKDRDPTEGGARRRKTGNRETGRSRGPEDPTAAWDPDRTLPAPSPAEPAPPSGREPGETFGSYRLEARLGRGGFGEVWEAIHGESGRRVALKLLTAKGETTPEARERFHREARLAASVSHPHCVFLFGAEEVDGRMAVAMELMEGGTLQELLDAQGRLPYRRAVDAVLDLVDGLETAHEKGIIHRDVKPSNCFLDGSGGVKIGDFGLSKTLEAEEALTVTGTYLGTPAYSSPEQVRGREIDFRSDVFSLGVLLYHLVAGERPFGSGPATHVLGRILFEDPKPPSEHGVEVPKGLEKVIRRMMAKEPDRRFQSYDALRRALLPFGSRALTAPALPKRFGAYVIDYLILLLLASAILVTIGGTRLSMDPHWALQPWIQTLSATLVFLYFFSLEGLWRASLGKRLMGLRVLSAGGAPARWRQVLIRTALFAGVPSLPGLLITQNSMLNSLVGYGSLAAIMATMRKRNGYAGVHELLSGTRVMTLPAARRKMARAARGPAGEEMLRERVDPRFGPYQVLEPVWSRSREELLEGFDPLLHRRVWLHVVEERVKHEGDARQVLAGDRPPAHLQWLQAGAEGAMRWNAFEHLDGSPLLASVTRGEPIDWPHALLILRNLAGALADEAGGPNRWNLAHVWVEPGGRVRLLPFPWPSTVEGDEEAARPRPWQSLLHGASSVLLQGRLPADGEDRIDRPLPRSFRRLLERLSQGGVLTVEDATSQLDRLEQRGGSLSRLQRAGALAPSAIICAVIGLTPPWAPEAPPSPRKELPERLRQWHALEGAADPQAEPRREALAALLAQGYLEAKSHRSEEDLQHARSSFLPHRIFAHYVPNLLLRGSFAEPTGPYGLPRGISAEDQKLLARLASDREKLEPEELEGLRAIAGPTWTRLWRGLSLHSLIWIQMAVVALLLAALLRGGLGFRLAFVDLQRRDGDLAGRGRCALRALISWSPFVAPWVFWVYLESHHPLPALLAAAAPLLLLAGALYAVWHPTRGLQDRLAGTWLMPR